MIFTDFNFFIKENSWKRRCLILIRRRPQCLHGKFQEYIVYSMTENCQEFLKGSIVQKYISPCVCKHLGKMPSIFSSKVAIKIYIMYWPRDTFIIYILSKTGPVQVVCGHPLLYYMLVFIR